MANTTGNQLRKWREGKKYTKEHVALMLGVTRSSVLYWETGLRRPKPKQAKRIESLTSIPWTAWF